MTVHTFIIFSVLLNGALIEGGAIVGTGGAGICGGIEDVLPTSTDTLLLSLTADAVPLGSWWLFSGGSGNVAERLDRASLRAEGAIGGTGGAVFGRLVALTPPPLTVSDLKNSSRLLCNCNQ